MGKNKEARSFLNGLLCFGNIKFLRVLRQFKGKFYYSSVIIKGNSVR